MTREEQIYFFKGYLYSRRYLGILFVLFFLLLAALGFLFQSQLQMLFYILSLLLFVSLPLLAMDVAQSYKQFQRFLWYREDATPQSALERLLAERLEEKAAEVQQLDEAARQQQADLLDYFTLWAHQIKTPIAASRLLLGNSTDLDTKKPLQQELFKIETYANLVLQYLRLESFHEDLVLRQENLEDLVKEVVKKYALFFIQKQLTVNLHDLDQTVVTDRKWLSVVLEQIISNSVKYTQTGGLEIFIKEGVLYLKDTGLGVQASDIERVFERGFSGYNGRLTQQSSGLGLYLSKRIVDKLGYSIRLESQVGQGTTVMIDLKQARLVFE